MSSTPTTDTSTESVEAMCAELREASGDLQSVAWSRLDGGQQCSLNSIVADKAEALLIALAAERDAAVQRAEAAERELRNADRLAIMRPELSQAELRMVDKHCDWPSFRCAFQAIMKSRARAAAAKNESDE